jgi:putative ABC transport system permease protein
VKALDRKLLRDLWSLKAQAASIALVVACGIGAFIASFATYESLLASRDHYYETARFPHVFAEVRRAPRALLPRIVEIPGVAEAETRVVREVQLDVPEVPQPMIARVIGADFAGPQTMNRLTLASGRWPVPGARGEVVVNRRFMEARGLELGARVNVLLNGKREPLAIVGSVLSPEYIYATRGGALPDDEWFAVFWMDAKQLAAAFNMEGAFNSVILRLEPGASTGSVIAALDRLLEPYGAPGAYEREDQISHRIISQEIEQQRVMGTVLPSVFLLVAAFILNVVLHRQVNAQRSEIAALKALGYADGTIARHYLKLTAAVVAGGVVIGVALGYWLGGLMTALYTDFFAFPQFLYRVSPWVVLTGIVVTVVAASSGALAAIRSVVRLHPAEALRPPAPAVYRPLLLERVGLVHLITPAQRMIFRNLERRPVRAALTISGVAGAIAILISGTFWRDALDQFIEVQFHLAQPADVYLGFVEAVPETVRADLERLPGVMRAEVSRSIGVRIAAGHRTYRTAVTGLKDDAELQRVVDKHMHEATARAGALLLTTRLARRLGVATGDTVMLELTDGKRTRAEMRVGGTVDELAGMNVWMRLEDLNRLAGEGPLVSSAALLVDPAQELLLLRTLKEVPGVATVIVKSTLLDTFRATTARNLLFFTAILTVFAATIAFGVVYNNARIQLAERSWELASLRVLGFTRAEVSLLLLGQLAVEIALAIPIGFVLGYGLASLILILSTGDVYEIPMVILPATYLYGAVTVIISGLVSALVVRHKIDHLDLVAVLKTRE